MMEERAPFNVSSTNREIVDNGRHLLLNWKTFTSQYDGKRSILNETNGNRERILEHPVYTDINIKITGNKRNLAVELKKENPDFLVFKEKNSIQ